MRGQAWLGQAGLENDGKDSGQHQRGTREAAQQWWDRWTQKLEALVVQSNPTVADQIRSSDLEFMARSTRLG